MKVVFVVFSQNVKTFVSENRKTNLIQALFFLFQILFKMPD